jgi:CRP-like cAMP-binding protein
MNGKDSLELLSGISFFRGISEEHLRQVAEIAALVNFAQGTVIFREGEPASKLFLIVSGNVALELCAPGVGCRRILTVSEGELLGWSPVLEQSCLTATARALTNTLAVEISGGQILTMCEHNPRFGYEFMRRAALALAKRLTATRMQLLDVYGEAMPIASEKES